MILLLTLLLLLTAFMGPEFSINSLMPSMNGFWKTRYTLTKIDLTFPVYESPIAITNILFYLPYLETLVVNTYFDLSDKVDDMERLQEPHRSLIDLTINGLYVRVPCYSQTVSEMVSVCETIKA